MKGTSFIVAPPIETALFTEMKKTDDGETSHLVSCEQWALSKEQSAIDKRSAIFRMTDLLFPRALLDIFLVHRRYFFATCDVASNMQDDLVFWEAFCVFAIEC